MSFRLTKDQIQARIVVYDELICHLEHDIYETEEERKQGKVIIKQIVSIKNAFSEKHEFKPHHQ